MKNKRIMHFVKKGRYICIRAVKPTKEKSTNKWGIVTCRNCLKIGGRL